MARTPKAKGATPQPAKTGATPRTAKTSKGATPAAKSEHVPRHHNELYTPQQIITALEASAGIISAAARVLRCDRKTLYNYIKRYPEIADHLEQIEEDRLDLAEAGLVGFLGDKKNPTLRLRAIEFYLRTKGKRRGYTMATEVMGKDGGPIETKNVSFDLSSLSAEELAVLEKAALIGVAKASQAGA